MELKDILYSIGIISTLVVSVYSLYINSQNRKNVLREHLYKEQIVLFSKIFISFNSLNDEADSLLNNPGKRKENNFNEILVDIAKDLYSSQFIIPIDITETIERLLLSSNNFYITFLGSDEAKIAAAYSEYFKNYFATLDLVKKFIGTTSLSDANRILHTKTDYSNTKKFRKVITDIVQTAIKETI